MKTYFRLLSFAQPLGRFAFPYLILSVLGILFGILNFTLLEPVLNVLFVKTAELKKVLVEPLPAFSADYVVQKFNYELGLQAQQKGLLPALRFTCVILVISSFLANIFKFLSQRIIETLRTHIVRNLRNTVFNKVTSMHLGYFSNERKGDVISRITTDVQEVEYSVASTLSTIIKEPLTIVFFFFILLRISLELTLFTLIIIPVSGIIIGTITKRLRREARQGAESLSRLLTILDETLGGMRVIKAFNGTKYIQDKFGAENTLYNKVIRQMAIRRESAPPVSEFMGTLIVAGILLYGGNLVLNPNPELSASEFVTYVVMFSQVLRPAKSLSTSFSNIQRGLASGERIFAILDAKHSVEDSPKAVVMPAFSDNISFNGVTFSYQQEKVLDNLTFSIKKGQTVALVGPSGGGKSTIADLIPRFYDVDSGAVTVDGINVKDYDAESLRQQMGVVTQDSILFNDTIFNNIAFCKTDATEAEVIAAAKVANAHDFILETENGYQTVIGDRGMKLSGGQRQRLSIARAVLKNPEILILDEATSALDTESEKLGF